MIQYLYFFSAAAFEIAGCYTFWMWLRLGKNILWLVPGLISLVLFAMILTKVDAGFSGRVYAAYGGIYIVSSLAWLVWVEQSRPLTSDYVGAAFCLAGAAIILFGAR